MVTKNAASVGPVKNGETLIHEEGNHALPGRWEE